MSAQEPQPSSSDLPDLPHLHAGPALVEWAELVVLGLADTVPASVRPEQPGIAWVLEDDEGVPVAVLHADGRAQGLRPFTHGPLRRTANVAADRVREQSARTGVVLVPVTGPLTHEQVTQLRAEVAARHPGRTLVWVAVTGAGRPGPLSAVPLWRALAAVATDPRPEGPGELVRALAVPLTEPVDQDDAVLAALLQRIGDGICVRPGLPIGDLHPAFAAQLARLGAPAPHRGATVLFTGLSGSGKSTVARAVAERITLGLGDQAFPGREVSLLDGDEVRRMLSAGLGFSRADRDLNVLRIGFVAAEITRHGGLAVCAPIAPFAQTRDEVARRVRQFGDFVLVHVNTPLAECERRDRKGLYAAARAGRIPEFTGISSPYEEPSAPDLRLDTSVLDLESAVTAVLDLLAQRGLLTPVLGGRLDGTRGSDH